MAELDIREEEGAVTVKVFVQPRAHRDKILGVHEDALKVQVTAPPVEGAANDVLCGFFARALKIPKRQVAIVGGVASRNKVVRIHGATRADIEALIAHATTKAEPKAP